MLPPGRSECIPHKKNYHGGPNRGEHFSNHDPLVKDYGITGEPTDYGIGHQGCHSTIDFVSAISQSLIAHG